MKQLLLILSLGIAFSACNKKNDQPAGDNATQAVRDPALQGKTFWSSKCAIDVPVGLATVVASGHAIKAYRVAYGFDGAQVTKSVRFFENADCTGASAATFREVGSMNIMQDKKTADGAMFVDWKYDNVFAHIDSDLGRDVGNAINLCKANNWTTNEERNVTGVSQDITCVSQTYPRVEMNIYRVEGNSLILGGNSPAANVRPSTLDRGEKVFVQQ